MVHWRLAEVLVIVAVVGSGTVIYLVGGFDQTPGRVAVTGTQWEYEWATNPTPPAAQPWPPLDTSCDGLNGTYPVGGTISCTMSFGLNHCQSNPTNVSVCTYPVGAVVYPPNSGSATFVPVYCPMGQCPSILSVTIHLPDHSCRTSIEGVVVFDWSIS